MEYKVDDSWKLDTITPLQDAVGAYENGGQLIYELNNCVRTMSLVEMRDELLAIAEAIKDAAEQIEDDDVVVEDDE